MTAVYLHTPRNQREIKRQSLSRRFKMINADLFITGLHLRSPRNQRETKRQSLSRKFEKINAD